MSDRRSRSRSSEWWEHRHGLTPMLLIIGQYLDVTVGEGFVDGIGVVCLVAAIPAFVFVLWGRRVHHGGLGRLGQVTAFAAVISPLGSLIAGYFGLFVGMGLLGLAVVVGITLIGGDAGDVWFYPMALTVGGYLGLGWHLVGEPAVDAPGHRHGPLATA